MAKVLFPRSDSVSPRLIKPSDWHEYFKGSVDHILNGFTVTGSAGVNRSVDIAVGKAVIQGVIAELDATDTTGYTFGSDNTHYLYIQMTRDGSSQPLTWQYTSNTTGTLPTDSLFLAKVVCSGGDVSSVQQNPIFTGINRLTGSTVANIIYAPQNMIFYDTSSKLEYVNTSATPSTPKFASKSITESLVLPFTSATTAFNAVTSSSSEATETSVTTSDDFSSDTWTHTGNTISGGLLNGVASTNQNRSYKAITAVSNTVWVMEFDLRITSETATGTATTSTATRYESAVAVGIVDDGATLTTATREAIGLGMGINYDGSQYKRKFGQINRVDGVPLDGTNTYRLDELTSSPNWVLNTWYYFKIIRTSATSVTFEVYSASTRKPAELLISDVVTVSSSIVGLDNLFVMSGKDATASSPYLNNYELDNVKVWNSIVEPRFIKEYAIDSDSNRYWKSASETGANIVVDFGSSTLIDGIELTTHSSTTATELEIYADTSNPPTTLRRTILVSALTHGSANLINWHIRSSPQNVRYVKISVKDGTAKILSIDRIRTRATTNIVNHRHNEITATDNTLSLVETG